MSASEDSSSLKAPSHPLVFRASELEERLHHGWSCPGIPRGRFPRGALIELSGKLGTGKTEWLLREFFAAHPEPRIAWLEKSATIYPPAFPQNCVSLERVLFVECGTEMLWSAQQILRSGLFPWVVLEDPPSDPLSLKRLQLAAEKAEASVFLLKSQPTEPRSWAIQLQLAWNPTDPKRPWKKLK